jgi:hypothetical protein
MTAVTLVAGGSAGQREEAIAAQMQGNAAPDVSTALILEGLPNGTASFDHGLFPNVVHIVRLAPGCPCCSGNLVMRVTLNRILRHPPAQLYIGLSTVNHLEQVRKFLTQPPYHELLALGVDLVIQDIPANADKIIRAGIQA